MPTCAPKNLTPRLRQTADLVVLGLSAKQIAEHLEITIAAVHDRTKRLHVFFAAANNASLAVKYREFRGGELTGQEG